MDPRWREVADVLVQYSTAVQPGERVMIAMVEAETFPLAHAVYEACIEAGAFPAGAIPLREAASLAAEIRQRRTASLAAGDRGAGHGLG